MNENTTALVDWVNAPTVADLREDLTTCKSEHDSHVARIDEYLKNLKADPLPNKVKGDVRSTIQPRLIRKHAEWRYASLTEPFLSASDIFRVNPITYEDAYSAQQNELVLNYQFNTQLNKIKLIDSYVRAAVDTGTAILRVGWEELESVVDVPIPTYQAIPVDSSNAEGMARFNRVSAMMADTIHQSNVPDYWKQCITRAQQETEARNQQVMEQYQNTMMQQLQAVPPEQQEQMQQQMMDMIQQQIQALPPIMYEPQEAGTQYTKIGKTINRPTIELCDYRDVYIDPSCKGDIDKAEYIVFKYTSCKADLLKDPRYSNVEAIPESTYRDYDDHSPVADFKDSARRKLTVYEYWGNWDINNDGTKTAIVASWVGETMLRLEENPYPDHKPPFVVVEYLPIANDIYGEPDGALLSDNQDIIGAVTRGIIDLLAKSANSQTGTAVQFLDPVNKKKFHEGRDYEYNPTMPPQQAIFQHTFPEIPQTVMPFLQSLEMEAEALTGVKGYSQGISGNALGDTATGVRGTLDAASKREMGILRRLADGLKQVARKIIAMNALWLNDKEVIRITNQDFVEVKRDDLSGEFDLSLDITSAEQDNAKAESLAFMLQTLGNTIDQSMTQMILSEICKLKKMPELAERVQRWQPPQPDPIQQELQQMQIELLKAQVQKYQSEANKNASDAQLNNAKTQSELVDAQIKPQELMSKIQSEMSKAEYNKSLSRKLDNDLTSDISGIKHKQELEKQSAQAKAQADKSFQEKYMDLLIAKEKEKLKTNK